MRSGALVFVVWTLAVATLCCAGSGSNSPGWSSGPAGSPGQGEDGGGSDGPPVDPVGQNNPGSLVITAPKRAAFIVAASNPTVIVTGAGATPALTINGQHANVSPDGSFTAVVMPSTGLNLIHAVDGGNALDVPFLYGTFKSSAMRIGQAVALRANGFGITNPDPNAVSLAGLANQALAGQDLLASLQGQTFNGSLPASGSWTFLVTGTHYGTTAVQLSPRVGGLDLTSTVSNVAVDGTLTVNVFGQSPSGPVTLTANTVAVSGGVDVSLDAGTSSIVVDLPSANATMNNFQYHSNNAGFPCCVDGIMTGVLQPMLSKTLHDQVQQRLPPVLDVALSSFGLPTSLDLQPSLNASLDLSDLFDGVAFDGTGGTLSASALIDYPFGPNDPASKAPGWLSTAKSPGAWNASPAFGLAVSFDLANQALFTLWGQRGLAQTIPNVPLVGSLTEAPSLPPVLLPKATGGASIALGEVIVSGMLGGQPVTAAVTIVSDVKLSVGASPSALVLTPQGIPTVSLTWLSTGTVPDPLKQAIVSAAPQTLQSMITPVRLPLPALPLDAVAPGLAGKTAAFGPGAQLVVDAPSSHLFVYGDLVITP